MNKIIVAFSGGKDSTAMVLRLHELGIPFNILYTPTGNELPGVNEHIEKVLSFTGSEMIDIKSPTLEELIIEQNCLPNWRMRWCTRMIKIEPAHKWLASNQEITQAVGLRADEDGRIGIETDNNVIYPLREWGWGIDKVKSYNDVMNFPPPKRTDCAWCFYQTLYEWFELWKEYPDYYARGEWYEHKIGYTFRSPGRDTRPAALKNLRKLFENGFIPVKRERKTTCRVCEK